MEAVIRSWRWVVTVGLGLVVLSVGLPSAAHKLQAKRSVFFETVGASDLHVLIHLEIPHGKTAAALSLSFDLDRSGRLDASEEARLSKHLAERAQDALVLSVNGRPTQLPEARSEMKRGAKGGLELMLYGKLNIGAEAVLIGLESKSTAEAAEVVLLAGPRPVRKSFGRVQSDGSFRAELRAGSRIHFELGPS